MSRRATGPTPRSRDFSAVRAAWTTWLGDIQQASKIASAARGHVVAPGTAVRLRTACPGSAVRGAASLVSCLLSSFAVGVVQVRAAQGRRGRDTGSYVDRGERREVRAWAARTVKRLRGDDTGSAARGIAAASRH
jgi:hypothetical protein